MTLPPLLTRVIRQGSQTTIDASDTSDQNKGSGRCSSEALLQREQRTDAVCWVPLLHQGLAHQDGAHARLRVQQGYDRGCGLWCKEDRAWKEVKDQGHTRLGRGASAVAAEAHTHMSYGGLILCQETCSVCVPHLLHDRNVLWREYAALPRDHYPTRLHLASSRRVGGQWGGVREEEGWR